MENEVKAQDKVEVNQKLLVKASFVTSDMPDKMQEGTFSIAGIHELGKVIDFLVNSIRIIRLTKFEFDTEVVL